MFILKFHVRQWVNDACKRKEFRYRIIFLLILISKIDE